MKYVLVPGTTVIVVGAQNQCYDMQELIGQEMQIECCCRIEDDKLWYSLKDCSYLFREDWLEPVFDEEEPCPEFLDILKGEE